MSHIANTPYKDNNLASDYHRISGKYCYVTDIDLILSGDKDNQDNMFFEYTYKNNEIEPIACIDWKMPGKSLSDKYSPIQAQIAISNKLGVPFYFIITYLDDKYPVKCYYAIPINKIARQLTPASDGVGSWLSLQEYSKFQHQLRKLNWNSLEPIETKNLQAVNLPTKLTLGELPNDKKEYPLPILDFSWQ